MIVKIRRDGDPFKKYWWVLLLVFGLVGGWMCLPMMESGGGASAAHDQGLKPADQSLDSLNNPSGAPGSAVDLAMGAYRKKGQQSTMKSSLYEPPPEAPAAAPGGPANLADALKDISRRSASADSSGWGGEKAQRGFTPPHANFGSLSGVGGGGSGTSAMGGGSYGGGGGGAIGAFGTEGPKTGLAATRGLGSESARPTGGGGGTMKALESASGAAVNAAKQGSFDASASMAAQNFDGGAGAGHVAGPGGAALGGAGDYAKLDSAPANLKMNDPKLKDAKDLKAPPPKPVPPKDENDMGKMIAQMIIMMMISGVMGAVMSPITNMFKT